MTPQTEAGHDRVREPNAVERPRRVLVVSYYREETLTALRIAEALGAAASVESMVLLTQEGAGRDETAREVRRRGFALSEEIPPSVREFGRFGVFRATRGRRAWAEDLLRRLAPDLILSTNDAAEGQLLIAARAMGIPALYVQWTDVWSRESHIRIAAAEEQWNDRQHSPLRRMRRRLARRLVRLAGQSLRWPFDNQATRIALAGPFYFDMCLEGGIGPDRLIVTGNPQCDDIDRASRLTETELRAIRSRIGIRTEAPFLLYAAEHTERIRHLSEASAREAVRAILAGMRATWPAMARVVKLHPKHDATYERLIRDLDPEAIVLDASVELGPLIAASSLVVSVLSSSLLWAVGIGRPAVSAFFWEGVDELRDQRFWSGVECPESYEGYCESLRRQLADESHSRTWQKRRLECRERFLVADGRSTERLVGECLNLLGLEARRPVRVGAQA